MGETVPFFALPVKMAGFPQFPGIFHKTADLSTFCPQSVWVFNNSSVFPASRRACRGGYQPLAVLITPYSKKKGASGEKRAAAAGGGKRQPGFSAATPLAGRRRSRPGNGKCGKVEDMVARHFPAGSAGREFFARPAPARKRAGSILRRSGHWRRALDKRPYDGV